MKKFLLALVLLTGAIVFAEPPIDFSVGGAEFLLLRQQAFERENFTPNMELIKKETDKEYANSIPDYDASKIKQAPKIQINSTNEMKLKNDNGIIKIERN